MLNKIILFFKKIIFFKCDHSEKENCDSTNNKLNHDSGVYENDTIMCERCSKKILYKYFNNIIHVKKCNICFKNICDDCSTFCLNCGRNHYNKELNFNVINYVCISCNYMCDKCKVYGCKICIKNICKEFKSHNYCHKCVK